MSQSMMSVSSLNTKIKSLLEATFMHTMVEGEVASVTYHTSGHLYFSIKDDKSSIKCVMWRSSVAKMKFRIEKGMHIVVEGSVSVYTPRGEYQFQTVRIEPYGQGALALAFEQLKKKLKEKGYFDATHKKPIPKQIEKIALVTAKESAALYDMLKIIEKRWAMVEVYIVDTLVQGEQASEQIANALMYADTLGVDVVVVGRGGGSAEDLWAFNEERVADAIYAMKTPTVSAVGHEVDVMISDFVADLRAPTPSAAIEMILPDSNEILYALDGMAERFTTLLHQQIKEKEVALQYLESRLLQIAPTRKLDFLQQQFKDVGVQLNQVMGYKVEQYALQLPKLQTQLEQNLSFVLREKEQVFEFIKEKFMLHNPKLKSKKGWAEVTQDGQKIELESLKVQERFSISDAKTKVEAVVVGTTAL